MEKRYSASVATIKEDRLVGYVARFNQPARVVVNGRTVTERFAPGAFRRTLAERREIVGLLDHDVSRVIGRTSTNTLRLNEDAEGLAFECLLPDTQYARDAHALAKRGDMGGGSIGFRAVKETWNADKSERTIFDADLFEVSAISAVPAYDTVIHARAAEQAEPLTARRRRLRLIELGGAS